MSSKEKGHFKWRVEDLRSRLGPSSQQFTSVFMAICLVSDLVALTDQVGSERCQKAGIEVSRRKQEAGALVGHEKGCWKFHLVFNLKMERGRELRGLELRDCQRRTQRQKGRWIRESQRTKAEEQT